MLFPVHLTLCFKFLFLWASSIAANASNPCQDIKSLESFFQPDLDDIELQDIEDRSRCLFYPTNVLNCSWSLDHLQDTQIVPHISVCDNVTLLQSWTRSTEERAGSASFTLQNVGVLYVVLQFHITLQDNWTVYTKVFDKHNLEVSPPPENISPSLRDENLLVTWSLPKTLESLQPSCFQYQLDIGDGEEARNVPGVLSYTVANVDPSQTYRVRMRASLSNLCHPRPHWSEWSHVAVVEPSDHLLSSLVIVLIFLGIPMILLAVLLVVRSQRVCKTFFPPIPRPPPKYMNCPEKNHGFNTRHPHTPAEEEVITVVLCE